MGRKKRKQQRKSWAQRRADLMAADLGGAPHEEHAAVPASYEQWWDYELGWYSRASSREIDLIALEIFGGYYYCVGPARQQRRQAAAAAPDRQ